MGKAARYSKAIAGALLPLVAAIGARYGITDPELAKDVAAGLAALAVAVGGIVFAVPNKKN